MVTKKINTKLKAKIIEHHNTQGDFSRKVDRDPAFVSKVIHGILVLTEKEQKKWARLLKSQPGDLFPAARVKK